MKKRAAIVLVTLLSSVSWGKDRKLAPDFKVEHSAELVNVIVQFKHSPGEQHKSKIRANGGLVDSELPLVKALSIRVPANRLHNLANDPEVAYISPDRPLHSHLNNTAAAVNANYAWQLGYDGTGITVAVIDSGIHDSDDLHDAKGHQRVLYSQDFLGGGTDDQYGHGTHVAGILGGNGKNSICSNCTVTYRGIAPNVNLVNFHVLDKNGQGTDSVVINAIHAAIQLKNTYNIRIINLSLGRPVFESYTPASHALARPSVQREQASRWLTYPRPRTCRHQPMP